MIACQLLGMQPGAGLARMYPGRAVPGGRGARTGGGRLRTRSLAFWIIPDTLACGRYATARTGREGKARRQARITAGASRSVHNLWTVHRAPVALTSTTCSTRSTGRELGGLPGPRLGIFRAVPCCGWGCQPSAGTE